mgnify:CR=1 FL=1
MSGQLTSVQITVEIVTLQLARAMFLLLFLLQSHINHSFWFIGCTQGSELPMKWEEFQKWTDNDIKKTSNLSVFHSIENHLSEEQKSLWENEMVHQMKIISQVTLSPQHSFPELTGIQICHFKITRNHCTLVLRNSHEMTNHWKL